MAGVILSPNEEASSVVLLNGIMCLSNCLLNNCLCPYTSDDVSFDQRNFFLQKLLVRDSQITNLQRINDC